MVIDYESAVEMFGHLLIRVFMIFMGYLAGVISFGLAQAVITVFLREDGVSQSIQLPGSTVPFMLLSFYYFFRPVLLIVSVAEILGCRNVAYYAGTWALMGYAISSSAKPFLPPLRYDVLFAYQDIIWASCGVLGGITYWAVAGRLARPLFRTAKKNARSNHLREKRQ
jgi:predicted membrane protein